MSKKTILIQLDCDEHASVFDRVVAIDSGLDVLFSHSNVKPEQVRELVHGAIFTRGSKDLHQTAFFIGGSNVEKAQEIHFQVIRSMIPQYGLTVSSMMDANGCNTTAVAAVRTILKSIDCTKATALILAGTGPVGQRVASLLTRLGCIVFVGSRNLEKAEFVSKSISSKRHLSTVQGVAPESQKEIRQILEKCDILISCGAVGIKLVDKAAWTLPNIKIALDLNGVPPAGVEGIEPNDSGGQKEGIICFGALGVGKLKIKIHRRCIGALFENNQTILDEDTIFDLSDTISDK